MAKSKVALGIDIGGTNTVFGLVDEKGKIESKESIPTNAMNPAEDLFKRLFEKFAPIYNEYTEKFQIIGIGVGAPNANYYTGSVENPPNLNWGMVNLITLIKKYYDLPVAVTNDANAAALGELKFGAARGMKNFIEITLGTGLGSGIVVNGDLLYGHSGFAGEMGHTSVIAEGRKCGCGKRGCLETYASAPGLKRTVFELLANSTESSVLRDVCYNELTSKKIFEAAKSGDKIATNAFKFTGKILGQAMADAVAYLSPEAFVLFGGLAQSGELLLEPTRKHLENNLLSIFRGKVKILLSGLPEGDAAILGASALIWHELKNNS
ncbi:MAG: glucokinase [Ignavibacteriales bacterium CG_4_9_14_3_um_filter_34_10]|nr:MAG: glucokinase [Ignavibacteriales bacterium CG_4_9_14_3_um_filter_34_10]